MRRLLLSVLALIALALCYVPRAKALPDGTIIQDGWLVRADMPTARSDFIPVVVNNQLYVAGGCTSPQLINGTCFTITNVLEQYDFASNKWATMAPMPRDRTRYAATAYQDLIFILGGRDINDKTVQEVDVYSITNNSWSTYFQADGLMTFSDPLAFTIGSKIYVTGGYDDQYHTRSATFVLDMANNNNNFKFLQGVVPDRHFAFGDIGGAVVNGKAYLYGGWNQTDFCNPQNAMESYDPTTNTWTVLSPSIFGRGDMGITAIRNQIYVAGGETKAQPCTLPYGADSYSIPVGQVSIYDTITDTWTVWSSIAFPRFRFGAAAYGTILYDIGGMGPYQNYSYGAAFPVLSDLLAKNTTTPPGRGDSSRLTHHSIISIGLIAASAMLLAFTF